MTLYHSESLLRPATVPDMPVVQGIACRAQEKLAWQGSPQQIAGYDTPNLTSGIRHGYFHVLETADAVLGGAFVEPVTPERFPQIGGWGVADQNRPLWFLYGLVIDPPRQGQGWGRVFLQGLCRQAAPGILILDCWAGNEALRRFYTDAGLRLHGEFPENDYRIAVFTWGR